MSTVGGDDYGTFFQDQQGAAGPPVPLARALDCRQKTILVTATFFITAAVILVGCSAGGCYQEDAVCSPFCSAKWLVPTTWGLGFASFTGCIACFK